MKEPHVDVRGEYIDVAEGRISQTCNRTAVMQKLPDFVPALSHHLKPLLRDGSQFTRMLFHPRINGGTPFDSAIESQEFRRFHGFNLSSEIYRTDSCAIQKAVVLAEALLPNTSTKVSNQRDAIHQIVHLRVNHGAFIWRDR